MRGNSWKNYEFWEDWKTLREIEERMVGWREKCMEWLIKPCVGGKREYNRYKSIRIIVPRLWKATLLDFPVGRQSGRVGRVQVWYKWRSGCSPVHESCRILWRNPDSKLVHDPRRVDCFHAELLVLKGVYMSVWGRRFGLICVTEEASPRTVMSFWGGAGTGV